MYSMVVKQIVSYTHTETYKTSKGTEADTLLVSITYLVTH
jgi:hypothetical protein